MLERASGYSRTQARFTGGIGPDRQNCVHRLQFSFLQAASSLDDNLGPASSLHAPGCLRQTIPKGASCRKAMCDWAEQCPVAYTKNID